MTETNLPKRPRAQLQALREAFDTQSEIKTWREFVAGAYEAIGCDGAVAVRWNGMHLLIERDGYRHS